MKGYPQNSMRNADILQRHHHSPEIVYGSLGGVANIDSPIKWTVTGGNDAWGTEIYIGELGGNTAGIKFDLNTLYVVSVSAANKISVIEIRQNTLGSAIAGIVTSDANDNFTKSGHGLVANDKVVVTNLVTTTGLDAVTVYHVINVVDATFQLALTQGGSAVVLGTGDGTCTLKKITASETITKTIISMSATNSDSFPIPVNSPRIDSTKAVTVRAKSESGSTIGIGFLLGCHTYNI